MLLIDGFNLIITVEVALSGGLILDCADGTVRDLAGLRGSYHPVDETDQALELIGRELGALGPAGARIFLDAPVSNSGRLRARIHDFAHRWPFPVDAELVPNPDAILGRGENAVSSDSAILDRCGSWLNVGRFIVDRHIPQAWRSGVFTLPSRTHD
jgi:hypothetical protein